MSRLDRAARLAVVLVLLALRPADAVTALPGDTMVYGEQQDTFRDGVTPFPSSGGMWNYQQLPTNPVTRPKFRAVANLENAVDTYQNNIGVFGKYVFVGNGQSPGLGGESSGLTMGVFDSETKQYCNLPIDQSVPSTNRHMIVGNPGKRQSRIIYAPVVRGITGEPAFGYLKANLDQDNPCTSWTVVSVTAQELDGTFPESEQLCPQGACEYDSVTLLAHQDVAGAGNEYGIDWVALGDYFHGNIAVIRIKPSDPQGIRDTGIKVMDTIKPQPYTAPGGVGCYVGIGAARLAAADVQRIAAGLPEPTNLRFTFSFDTYNHPLYDNGEQPASACPAGNWVRYCPANFGTDGLLGQVACDPTIPMQGPCLNVNCAKGFCATGYAACDTDAQCLPIHIPATCDSDAFDFPTGPCLHTALYKSRTQTCGYRTDGGTPSYRQCLDGFPPHCPNYPFEICWPPGNIAPSQEYKFDGTSISAVSPMFFSAKGLKPGPGPSALEYETDHSLWVGLAGAARGIYRVKVANESCNIDGQSAPYTVGEHCYYDETPDLDHASVVLPDRSFTTQVTAYSGQTIQVGSTTYIADDASVQQAVKFFGEWTPTAPTSYKVGLAYLGAGGTPSNPLAPTCLPAAPIGCTTSHASCDVDADCPAACGTCDDLPEDVGVTFYPNFKPLRLGGSPPSLWTLAGYVTSPIAKTATFLERVPTALYLDDNLSTVRPSVSWSGNRLWMVAEHDGQLKYRVRDDGVWGGWFPLGTEKIAAGGAAVVAGGSGVGVRIYARESGTNKLMEKRLLTSNLNCIPGSTGSTACTWLPWYNAPDIGAGITVADDPAATLVGTSQMAIAVRASNNLIYSIIDQLSFAASWSVVAGGLQTNAAPSVSYHPPDGKVWISARETSSGAVKVSAYPPGNPLLADPWAAPPTTGGPASTAGTAPAIVSDGTTIRLFGVEPTSAGWPWVWQIANDGSGWSNWRKPLGGSSATRQPVAANINGEIDLVTYWYTGGIQEIGIP